MVPVARHRSSRLHQPLDLLARGSNTMMEGNFCSLGSSEDTRMVGKYKEPREALLRRLARVWA